MDAPPTHKSSKSRRDTAVQGTNDSSIISKCSMVKFGYFSDNFLHKFVCKESRRSPLIHRGYFIRAKAIDFILREFLKRSGPKQIVSFGSGFDSTYFRLKAEGLLDETVFIELDFPQVVKRKANIIMLTDDLKCFIQPQQNVCMDPEIVINGDDYKLLGVDITDTSKVEELFMKCSVKGDKPTLFLSECVMTYIKDDRVSQIIRWTREKFHKAAFVIYEQINPSDAFGTVMLNHFTKIGSPLRCIQKYPTLQSQIERFTRAGWVACEALDMNQFFNYLLSPEEQEKIEDLEPFDEYEEWHLKCSHYMVLCAYASKGHQILNSCVKQHKTHPATDYLDTGSRSNTTGVSELDDMYEETSITDKLNKCDLHVPRTGSAQRPHDIKTAQEKSAIQTQSSISVETDHTRHFSADVQRFSHSSIKLQNHIFVSGGFGYYGKKHCRLGDACLLNLGLQSAMSTICSSSDLLNRMHHAVVAREEDCEVIIFGGRHSPLSPEKRIVRLKIKEVRAKCDVYSDSMCSIDVVGEMSPAIWRHTAVLSRDEKAVFIFGGKSAGIPVLKDCQVYHLASNTWDNFSFSGYAYQPRHSHSAVMWNSCMVISGGLDQQLLPLEDIILFDLEEQKCSCLRLIGELKTRYSHTSHIEDDILLLVGGVNIGPTPPGLAAVHLPTGLCQEYPLPWELDSGVIMYQNHSSFLTEEKLLLILGGGGNCFSFGTHFNNTPLALNISTVLQDFQIRIKAHIS